MIAFKGNMNRSTPKPIESIDDCIEILIKEIDNDIKTKAVN